MRERNGARSGAGRAPARLVTWLAAALAGLGVAVARPSASQQPVGGAGGAAQSLPAPSPDAIQAARAQVQGSESLEPAVRQSLLDDLTEAEAALAEAATLRGQAEVHERARAEAQPLLEEIHAELEQPAPEPSVAPPADASLRQLQELRDQARSTLDIWTKRAAELDTEKGRRAERRAAINEELPRLRQELSEHEDTRRRWSGEGLSAEAQRVRELEWGARREALDQRIRMLEAELASYDARGELLPLRRQRAQRRVALYTKELEQWEELVSERRRQDIASELAEAERLQQSVAERHPRVQEVAGENQELAELRSGEEGLQARIESARDRAKSVLDSVEATEHAYESTYKKVTAAGLTDATGLLLRREYGKQLRDVGALRRDRRLVERRLADAQFEQIVQEERLADLAELAQELRQLVEADREEGAEGAAELDELVDSLISARNDLLVKITTEYEQLLSALTRLDQGLGRLIEVTEEYQTYIEERILWVRSVTGSPVPEPRAFTDAFAWLLSPTEWRKTVTTALEELPRRWASAAALVLLLGFLSAGRRSFRRKLRATGDLVARHRTDRYVETLKGLAYTVAVALPVPLLLWSIGWALSNSPRQTAVGVAVGGALRLGAYILVPVRILDALLRPGGLGEAHFRWAPGVLQAVRRTRFAVPIFLSAFVVYEIFELEGNQDWSQSVGRLAFVVAFGLLTAVHHLLLRADGSIMQEYRRRFPSGWLWRFHRPVYGLATGLPALLVVLALLGYYFSALRLSWSLVWSLALVLGMLLLHALLVRWLFHTRRKLAVEQARARAQAKRAVQDAEDVTRESATAGEDEESVDIPALDARTRELFRSLIGLGLAVGLYWLWASALPALRMLDRVQVWPRIAVIEATESGGPVLAGLLARADAGAPAQDEDAAGGEGTAAPGGGNGGGNGNGNDGAEAADGGAAAEGAGSGSGLAIPLAPAGSQASTGAGPEIGPVLGAVTLLDVVLGVFFLLLMVLAARNLPELLEFGVLQRLPLDAGARYAITTILRYLIVIVGVTATLGVFGIGWSKVQWLAAALTFGLAFGLQEIFANFVSGIIILLERPVRVGDLVTVGQIEGRVTRLRMRATTIQDWDRREFLVPNKEFITGSLINWTLSDPITRLVLPVGIAYGSDTRLAKKLLNEVARECPHAMTDPAPSAIFRGFGDSSLEFHLRVFMEDRDLWPTIIDDLHWRVDEKFKAAGIEIAFPQRDLHLRSVDEDVKGLLGGRSEPRPDAAAP